MIPEMKLTSKGAALLAKVPAGTAVPVTKWQIGTGALAAGNQCGSKSYGHAEGGLPAENP